MGTKVNRNINNTKGNSLIELIMVMMLLVLFGVTIYTIIFAGTSAQDRIIYNKDSQIDARVALSYVNIVVRQNDRIDTVAVAKNPINNKDALLVRMRPDFEDAYDIWVFGENGAIYEFIGGQDEPPSLELSNIVLQSEGLDYQVVYDEATKMITNTVYYSYGISETQLTHTRSLSSTIKLRSQN